MTGKLYIDGQDAFTHYGIFVQDSGYAGLVQWPSLKSVDSNDWPEDDGIDADLSAPKLESKEFRMSFCCVDYEKTTALFQLLTIGAYHVFNFSEIGIEKELRLVSQPSIKTIVPLQTFSLQFADDGYMKGYVRQDLIPVASCKRQGYEIDDVDISQYGVRIVSGTLDNLLKTPSAKKNLSVDTKANDGAIYEDTEVNFQSRDITLKCILNTQNTPAFWGNFRAFLHDLTQPTERMLHLPDSNEYFSCHYKSSNVSKFTKITDGGVWCEFDVTLCFVSSRPGQVEYFLSAEDGSLIITEDSFEDYNKFIDMAGYEN